MERKEVKHKEAKIVYHTKGSGPAVVLLHGFGEDGRIWKNQYDIFPGHILIIPDLPGSGESEMIDDMSMDGLAEAVKEIIDTESSGKVTLIGHSMGGYITLAYAEKYPDALTAFGLFHSSAYADNEEKKETRRKGISFMEQHGGFAFLKTSIPNLYAKETKEKKPQLIEEHVASVRNFSGAAHVKYYKAMMQRPDRTEVLKKSEVPVLFVMGKYDTAVPVDDGLKQSHLPQLSYIHLLENSAHMGMVEEMAESNKILSQFIETVAKPAYT